MSYPVKHNNLEVVLELKNPFIETDFFVLFVCFRYAKIIPIAEKEALISLLFCQ